MTILQEIIRQMEPATALSEIAQILGELLSHQDEEKRVDFLQNILGNSGESKVGSMVNLWLAECMDEGVDPTKMCQTLVNRVATSRQLQAISHPEITGLFEDWLDELEEEVLLSVDHGTTTAEELASKLSLSLAGADFLLTKLQREGKISEWRLCHKQIKG